METKIEKTTSSISKEKCPECESANLVHDYDNGETVCGDCGLVLYQAMDTRTRRAYDAEQIKSRIQSGPPELLTIHDKGLSTKVGYRGEKTDACKNRISSGTLNQIHRLDKWQTRSRVGSTTDRNIIQAMQEITRICDKLSLSPKSSIRQQSAFIYKKALKEKVVRGRSINAIAAASVYYACRITETPKDLTDVSNASLVDRKDLSRCYRLLHTKLEIRPPVSNPILFVSKIAEATGISGISQGLAISLLNKAPKFQFGNRPEGSAAAVLYIACLLNKEKITQKDIANAAGVTEVTVRNRYKVLTRILHIEFPDN